jgi:2-dehydro-3-deoxygluconokinase
VREAAAFSFDVNYRAALWSPAAAREFAERVLPAARHVFLGQSEAETVFGLTGPPESAVEALAKLAPKATVALLQGEAGSLVLDGGRLWRPSRRHTVQVVDPVGAGDAFVAGFLWATLGDRGAQAAVDAGAAVAALKCSTWGDIALVDPRDVDDLLAGGPDVRR